MARQGVGLATVWMLAWTRAAMDYEFVISLSGERRSGFPEFISMDGNAAAHLTPEPRTPLPRRSS
jgi:hypothetical protein